MQMMGNEQIDTLLLRFPNYHTAYYTLKYRIVYFIVLNIAMNNYW